MSVQGFGRLCCESAGSELAVCSGTHSHKLDNNRNTQHSEEQLGNVVLSYANGDVFFSYMPRSKLLGGDSASAAD